MNENPEPSARTTIYRSFLLRLWCSDASPACGWQASLHDPLTGHRYGFASLEELFAFLMELDTSPERTETRVSDEV